MKAKFADAQITVTGDGSITAEQIDADKLIDVHYYAIASKAVLKKPHELNVPADKFEKQFGLGWQDALDQGKHFISLKRKRKKHPCFHSWFKHNIAFFLFSCEVLFSMPLMELLN